MLYNIINFKKGKNNMQKEEIIKIIELDILFDN